MKSVLRAVVGKKDRLNIIPRYPDRINIGECILNIVGAYHCVRPGRVIKYRRVCRGKLCLILSKI